MPCRSLNRLWHSAELNTEVHSDGQHKTVFRQFRIDLGLAFEKVGARVCQDETPAPQTLSSAA
jgi:hypothetical protein